MPLSVWGFYNVTGKHKSSNLLYFSNITVDMFHEVRHDTEEQPFYELKGAELEQFLWSLQRILTNTEIEVDPNTFNFEDCHMHATNGTEIFNFDALFGKKSRNDFREFVKFCFAAVARSPDTSITPPFPQRTDTSPFPQNARLRSLASLNYADFPANEHSLQTSTVIEVKTGDPSAPGFDRYAYREQATVDLRFNNIESVSENRTPPMATWFFIQLLQQCYAALDKWLNIPAITFPQYVIMSPNERYRIFIMEYDVPPTTKEHFGWYELSEKTAVPFFRGLLPLMLSLINNPVRELTSDMARDGYELSKPLLLRNSRPEDAEREKSSRERTESAATSFLCRLCPC